MRIFNAIIGIATIISSTTLDAHARARSAPRPCMTSICLLRRIVTLETDVTDLTKQLDSANKRLDTVTKQLDTVNEQSDTLTRQIDIVNKQIDVLNKKALKSGQTVTLSSPSGCLSYSAPADISNGPVWWSHPCKNGNWTIQ
jgi:peptidoglycan hydrolase CwlO-like protein